MKFTQILLLALAGRKAWRSGWYTKFHLEVDNQFGVPILMRVADDGSSRIPWSPTEADMFTPDWSVEDGADIPVSEGSCAWALNEDDLLDGRAVRLPNWHPDMAVTLKTENVPFGKLLVLSLPDGSVAVYRPAPQDLCATNWQVRQ